jgi:hypothetical protein
VPTQRLSPGEVVFLFKGYEQGAEYIEEKKKTSGRDRGGV